MRRGLLLSGSAGITLTALSPAQAQLNRAQRRSIAPAAVPSLPASVPSVARIAIERARQLEAQGIPALAAVQYRTAVASAPTSVAAARELARFYGRQERWEESAEAWRQVLFLKHGSDSEANIQLVRAQNQLLANSDSLPADVGQSRIVGNIMPGAPAPAVHKIVNKPTTLAAAQIGGASQLPDVPTAPDLAAQAPAPAPAVAPPAPTAELPAPAVEAPAPIAAPPIQASTPATAPPPQAPSFAPPRVALPAPVAAPVSTNISAIPYKAPAKVGVRVSKVNAAKAWPFVNKAAKELTAGHTQNALKLYQSGYKLDPTNPYAGPGIGTCYIVLGRFIDATTAYRKFLAAKPGDAKGLRGLADALTYSQKYREALGVNNAILAKQPRDFAASYQNAQIATYLRSYAQSDKFFNIAAAIKPKDANVWAAWGESLSYRRDPRALVRFQKALAVNPRSARALTGLGNYYSYTSQFESAIPKYRASLAVRPGDVATLVGLGDALTYAGNQADAISYYRAALAKQPGNRAAHLGLGRALVYSGQSEAGASELRTVLSSDPSNAQALEALALAQTDYSPSTAVESYQTLLSRQSDPAARAKTLLAIGDLRARNNEFPKALEAYSQAARLAPNDPKINLAYAQALSFQEQYDAARPVVESVLSRQPDNAQALALQVQIESKSGNTALAQTLAAKLADINPANTDEALTLAEALRATGNPVAAKKVLDKAVATVNDPATALRLADATRDAADYTTAASLYGRILKTNPNNVDARLSYAQTLIYQKDLAGAQAQVQQVLKLDPTNIQAKVLLATVSLRADTPTAREDANAQANAILAADPNNSGALTIVGEVMTSRQRFAEAVTQFRNAVQAQPNNLEARLGLARNLYYSRDVDGAIAEYRELNRRVPTDTLPRLELAQIYLDRNRFSDAEALYNEVLALRRGLPVNATARWKVETRAYARLNPLAKLNSPLRVKTMALAKVAPPRHRVEVVAPAKIIKTSAGKNASKRTLLAQNTAAPASASAVGSLPAAPDVTVPDLGASAPAAGAQLPAPTSIDAGGTPSTAPDATIPTATDATPPVEAAPVSAPTVGGLDPVISDQVVALRGLGEIRRRQERFAESLDYFNQALALDSTDAASHIGVAQALRGQAKYVDALQETEHVLAVDPQNLSARVLHAQLLGDTGKPQQAQTELDQLVSSLPDNASLETYTTLSQAFNTLQNYTASLALLDEAAQLYPTEPAIPRLKAETLTFARRGPEAIAIYDTMISADPQDADAMVGKARVYNYSDQLALAATTYRQALAVQPNNYQATTELADVLGRSNDYPASIQLYQSAIQANPTDLAVRVEMARVQRYAGLSGDAEATLNQVLEADANNVPALTERGVLRGTLGSYAPALADLNQALTISPSDLGAQLGLAEVQGYAGMYDDSIKGYRAVLARDPQNLRAGVQLGSVLSYAGQTDAALKQLDAVLVANPNDAGARLAKADVLGRAKRTKESVALYNQILAADPQNLRARTGLADAYLYGSQYADAVKVYDALIAADPQTSSYKVQRARALGYEGNAREAIRSLREVVAAEPSNLPARLALAEAGTNSGDQTLISDAIADYRQILTTEPSNVTAQVGLGRALSYRGKYRESTKVLSTVLASTPGNTDARYALAENQRFAGKPFDAQKNYREVLKTQPTNTQARSGLRQVRHETAPMLTVGGSYYSDTNGVHLRSLNYGATLPTRAVTIGVLAERGRFSQNGSERDRNALSVILARALGPVQARLAVTKLKYDGADRKTLYDLLLNNVRGPREHYYLGASKRDIFESDAAVALGITAQLYRAGFTYPLGQRFDLEGELTRYRYSDSNNRTSIQPSIYYRFSPTNPSLRVGLGYFYDNTSQLRTYYYTPRDFKATSILADYIVDQGSTKWGINGAYALTKSTGEDNLNRPANTLFGFVQQDVGDNLELFANGGIVRTPSFRSNQINGGVNLRF